MDNGSALSVECMRMVGQFVLGTHALLQCRVRRSVTQPQIWDVNPRCDLVGAICVRLWSQQSHALLIRELHSLYLEATASLTLDEHNSHYTSTIVSPLGIRVSYSSLSRQAFPFSRLTFQLSSPFFFNVHVALPQAPSFTVPDVAATSLSLTF